MLKLSNKGLLIAATWVSAVLGAINPIEVKGKHFYDSVTKEPVCTIKDTKC